MEHKLNRYRPKNYDRRKTSKIKKITSEKKNIYPKQKPKTKSDSEETKVPIDDSQIADSKKDEVFIYPKKKPVLVQKKS